MLTILKTTRGPRSSAYFWTREWRIGDYPGALELQHELGDGVGEARQIFVSEIRVENVALLGAHLVVSGELGGWRADVVHERNAHQKLRFDAWCEVLHVNVAQSTKPLVVLGMGGIVIAEEGAEHKTFEVQN